MLVADGPVARVCGFTIGLTSQVDYKPLAATLFIPKQARVTLASTPGEFSLLHRT